MKPLIRLSFLFLMSLGVEALSDEVRVPVSELGDQTMPKAGRGLKMPQVEERFGAPDSRHGPVGDPPITYWDYPDFTVYFERDVVLHSVSKAKIGARNTR